MKTGFAKSLSVILAVFLFAFPLFACTGAGKEAAAADKEDAAISPGTIESAEPSETPALTGGPEQATERPGQESTEAPDLFTRLDFNSCAEELFRAMPHIGRETEAAPGTVTYIDASQSEGEPANLSSRWISSDGESVFVFDVDGRLSRFKDGEIEGSSRLWLGSACPSAAVFDGMIYTAEAAVSVEPGEVTELTLPEGTELCDAAFAACGEDGPYLAVSSYGKELIRYDRYVLNGGTEWTYDGEICTLRFLSGGTTSVSTPEGTGFTSDSPYLELIGRDADGSFYFLGAGLMKYSADGSPVSCMELPFELGELWQPDLFFCLLPDGSLYVGVPFTEAYAVYRITM